MARALRPSSGAVEGDAFRKGRARRLHVTIVVYGRGYESAAEEAVPAVIAKMDDSENSVRYAAVFAFAEIGKKDAAGAS